MPVTILQLVAKITADTRAAEAGIIRTANTAKGALAPMAMLGAGSVLAAAAIGAAAIHMAGDFEQGITTLETGAGESHNSLKKVADGILNMAVATGTSTKQLTDGMYMIESAGFNAAKGGLDVLKAAAEGARVGNADLGTVADATTTIMKDFGMKSGQAGDAVNTLVATVARGKTHMQDLGQSLAMILPTASAAHVGLNDVMGAMATMTGEGVPAANAATYLRQMIIALDAPSGGATKALREIGLSSDEVATKMQQSLPAALKMITDHLKAKFPEGSAAYVRALRDISGGSREMQGMLDLTGKHLDEFKGNVGGIGDAVKQGKGSITGWSEVQKDFNFRLAQAREVGEKLMIQLGQKLLPVATQFVGMLADHAIPALKGFVSWISGSSTSANIIRPILITLAIAIGGALVASFIAWAVAAGAAAVATIAATWPILAIGAAIALLVAGFILAYNHIPAFKAAIDGIVGVVKNVIGAIGNLANIVGGLFKSAASQAQIHTQEMKVKTLDHVEQMRMKTIATLEQQKAGILKQLQQTKDPALRHALEMKLGVVNHAIDMNEKAVKQAEIQRQKVLEHIRYMKENGLQHAGEFAVGMINKAGEMKDKVLKGIGDFAKGFANAIKTGFKTGINVLIGDINSFISFLDGIQIHIPAIGVGPVHSPAFDWGGMGIGQIPYLAEGGDITHGGAAVVGDGGRPELVTLPTGARVTPLPLPGGMPGAGAGGGGAQVIEIHITTTLDGRVVAQSVARHLPTVIRNATGARAF